MASFFLRRKVLGWFRCGVAAGCGLAVWGAQGAERPVTVSLVELGQQTGGRPPDPGSTRATVHFVGDHHLLVTFPVRRLMKRMEDSEPGDDDRTIDAVLVDVPSGKVAARSSWRVHDRGQYVWELGHGQFLLRVRDRLVTIAPLANLSTEHPFAERPLLAFERRVVGVLVSAEEDLLTVETRGRQAAGTKPVDGPVELNFYRLEEERGLISAASAGKVQSRIPVELPMTREGYLDTSEEKKGKWVFDYISHGGKKTELSPYDTTCYPVAKFVSRSEFVAFGCRGAGDKVEIGGFDMRGEEMWQQNFFDSFVHPTFSFAPEAGRFALGRAMTTATASAMAAGADFDGNLLTGGQDVQVLQAHTGKQVFHTVITPVQRAGQNFALAPDGGSVAVIRGAAIEVYRLAGLSGRDQQDVKEAREVALERGSGAIVLPTRSRTTVRAETLEDVEAPAVGAGQVAPAATPKVVEHAVQVGDAVDDGSRKAPTLYKPGEEPAPKQQ